MAQPEVLEIGLGKLIRPAGSRKTRVRVGRGIGSGLGKTAGRGGKGQTARRGKGRPKGFEGGQMPLYRRMPKFGFKNPTRRVFDVVNLAELESNFESGANVDMEALVEKGLVRSSALLLKVLGDGTLTKKLSVKAHKFSKTATQKINQAGGQVEEVRIPGDKQPEAK